MLIKFVIDEATRNIVLKTGKVLGVCRSLHPEPDYKGDDRAAINWVERSVTETIWL